VLWGILTNRAVVMLVSMIPMFVLWWNVEGILLKLGQGESSLNPYRGAQLIK
jgi:hypothetical protein